jgi:hypothetical protein
VLFQPALMGPPRSRMPRAVPAFEPEYGEDVGRERRKAEHPADETVDR